MTQLCRKCGLPCGWVESPYGDWWAHLMHPADDHDAEIVEVVSMEHLATFAASLQIAVDQEVGISLHDLPIGLARILLSDLLDDGWRPPIG